MLVGIFREMMSTKCRRNHHWYNRMGRKILGAVDERSIVRKAGSSAGNRKRCVLGERVARRSPGAHLASLSACFHPRVFIPGLAGEERQREGAGRSFITTRGSAPQYAGRPRVREPAPVCRGGSGGGRTPQQVGSASPEVVRRRLRQQRRRAPFQVPLSTRILH